MSLTLYIGCMFSGKTSSLISECKKWQEIGKSVLCINYIKDNRFGLEDYLYSHDMQKTKCIKVLHLSDIPLDLLQNTNIIMINEGQFFTDLVDFCIKWCEKFNKIIYVCGLDGDFQRKPIGQINELIPLCDNVKKLTALCKICNDGTVGLFSWRKTNNLHQIVISNDYIPLCRKHYIEKTEKLN